MPEDQPRIGVIGIADGGSSDHLANACAARTGYRLLIDLSEVVLDLDRRQLWFEDTNLGELDAIILKKAATEYSPHMLDRLEMLRVLEGRVPIYSSPAKVIRLLDRLACTVTLRAAGLPMPPTVITESLDRAMAAVYAFRRAVLKPLFSTKAKGMTVIDVDDTTAGDPREQMRAFRAAGNPVLYVQQKLELPDRDLGVAFLGGEYVGTYARVRAPGTWNTTTRDGGRYAAASPKPETIALATRAQALFGLDFGSVDIVELPTGPLVFEVSAFGGFRGLREGAGIDAAERLVDHVLGRMRHD